MLKNNYKDDVLDVSQNTARKYRLQNNVDGTVTLIDETVYLQEGDVFGANDVNRIVEAIQGETIVNVPAVTWVAGTAPYAWQQVVPVSGMTSDTVVKIYPTYAGLITVEQIEAYEEAYPLIAIEAESVDGGLKLYCVKERPEIDLKVVLEGIGE